MEELRLVPLRWGSINSDLRALLALKPVTDMNKLMERVEEYKSLEYD